MGKHKVENLSIPSISNEVFEMIEKIFGQKFASVVFSLLVSSRSGLLETEIVSMLQNSTKIEGM